MPTNNNVNIRCSIVPSTSGYIKCSAFIEGPSGDNVSGALINVTDSYKQVSQLLYDTGSSSYSARIEENTDTYNFEITSVLLHGTKHIHVPYTMILKSPGVTVFQDSNGNSVLSGQNLDRGLPVQIAWSNCGADVSYQLAVKTALRTVYAVTTNAETIIIPENLLPMGTYTLTISAQKIHGDPLFKTADYYSLSNSTTVGLGFYVN